MICSRCNTVNPDSSKFCTECGAPLTAVPDTAASVPQMQYAPNDQNGQFGQSAVQYGTIENNNTAPQYQYGNQPSYPAPAPVQYGYDQNGQYGNAGQPQYGSYGQFQPLPPSRAMNKHVFVWVCCFLAGAFGVDRFVRGQVVQGILKLFLNTFTCGIWWLVDWIIALVKAYGSSFGAVEDIEFNYNGAYAR